MDAKKLKWIALGGFIAVVVLVWGVLQYLGGKAEDRLIDTLAEYNLEHRVHWQSASASLGGSVTLKDVRVDADRQGASGWQAERVIISDLTDDEERQRVTLEVEGLSAFTSEGEHAPVLGWLMGLPTGKVDLPPLDVTLALDARYDKDEAQVSFVLEQKEGMDVELNAQLTRIGVLRELARVAAQASQANSARGSQGFGFNPRTGMNREAEMPDWSGIRVKAMEVSVKDRGMMKRAAILGKRYNIPLDADGDSIKSQHNKAVAQQIKDVEARCRRSAPPFLRTKNIEQTCRAINRFTFNDADTLRASIAPRSPVPLVQTPIVALLAEHIPVLALFARNTQPLSAQVLNLEVKS